MRAGSDAPLLFLCIGGLPIPLYTIFLMLIPSISQAENREVLEIIRSQEDVLAAHQRVSGMNFILGGHVIPASIRDARDEVESQLIEGAPTETDTQPPSPNSINKTQEEEDDDDDDEPSTPKVIVISSSLDRRPLPPPQLQTLPASNPANTYSRKSKSLQVNIQQPQAMN